jgi:hypothetical protein
MEIDRAVTGGVSLTLTLRDLALAYEGNWRPARWPRLGRTPRGCSRGIILKEEKKANPTSSTGETSSAQQQQQ